jgi:hypothetical protein
MSVGNIAFGHSDAAVLAIALTDCIIDKVIFELVSSLARGVAGHMRHSPTKSKGCAEKDSVTLVLINRMYEKLRHGYLFDVLTIKL